MLIYYLYKITNLIVTKHNFLPWTLSDIKGNQQNCSSLHVFRHQIPEPEPEYLPGDVEEEGTPRWAPKRPLLRQLPPLPRENRGLLMLHLHCGLNFLSFMHIHYCEIVFICWNFFLVYFVVGQSTNLILKNSSSYKHVHYHLTMKCRAHKMILQCCAKLK